MAARVAVAALALLSAACERGGDTAEEIAREPAPPPPVTAADRACTYDDECVPVPGCCPAPCTSQVVNRRALERMEPAIRERCATQDVTRCPQAGSCVTHAYLCVSGACAFVEEGAPDYREPDARTHAP